MKKLTLAQLQYSLQGYVLNQHNHTDGLTIETAAFSQQQRLSIYHDAYRLRLIDALQNDYPALQLTLGEETFSELMLEYIARHPSQHPSLRWFGEKLPEFLRTHVAWQDRVATCELAMFEWAQIMAFDADNSIPATLDDLRTLPHSHWPSLQLTFQPGLQIINFISNVTSVWNALIKEGVHIDMQVAIEKQAWLIWRMDLQVAYRPLDKMEAWCMQAFLRNENFTKVCESLCEWLPEDQVPIKTVQYLQQWLQSGLIKTITATS